MATTHRSGSSVARGIPSLLEGLEQRRLMASISGNVWEDLDTSRAYNNSEPRLAGWTVFLDTNQNRRLDSGEQTTVTDKVGNYRFDDLAPGTYTVAEVLEDGYGQTFPGKAGIGQTNFEISLNFLGEVPEKFRSLFREAAAKWESIIVGDVPDVMTDLGMVDDILLDASVVDIDGESGILGQAAPTQLREGSFLPARGFMEFDVADLDVETVEGRQQAVTVITHEMGHTLGVGTIWRQKGLLTGFGTQNPRFTGAQATAEYRQIFRRNDETSVPVQAQGGPRSAYSHWLEDVFGSELMSPFIGPGSVNPLSRVTAGQLGDLGYDVNIDAAEPYTPGIVSSANNSKRPGRVIAVDYPATIIPMPNGGLTPSAKLARLPFSHVVTITGKRDAEHIDFGNRTNTGPEIRSLGIEAPEVIVGNNITIRALGITDREGDNIEQVTFFRESNGVAGLQNSGSNPDTYLGADRNSSGGFRIDAPTDGVPVGTTSYYARAYDNLDGAATRRGTNGTFVPTPPPTRPINPTAVVLSATSTRITFTDNSSNETRFQVQRSTNPSFSENNVNYTLAEGETSLDVGGLNPGGLYFYRVRARNVGGNSGWSTITQARNQITGEVVLDNFFNKPSVAIDGAWELSSAASGYFRRNYLTDGGTGKKSGKDVTYNVETAMDGEYYVYGRWTKDADNNSSAVPYTFGSNTGRRSQTVVADQSERGGGWVLLGTYEFGKGAGNAITISTKGTTGVVVADSIRILPTTETLDKINEFYGLGGGVGASSLRAGTPTGVVSTGSVTPGVSTAGVSTGAVPATSVVRDGGRTLTGFFADRAAKFKDDLLH